MSADEKGRFCSACQKTVYDFTQSSDRVIAEKINSGEKICGRFDASQLDRKLVLIQKKPTFWSAGMAGVFSLMALESEKVIAQEIPETVQTDAKKAGQKIGEVAAVKMFVTVTGKVSDDSGLPIPMVKIVNQRTKAETQTDLDGNFTIESKINDVLVFSFLGFKNAEKTISEKTMNVQMETEHLYLGGIVVTGKPIRPPFLTRVYHSITDWFR